VFPTLFEKLNALFASGRVLASEEVLREFEKVEKDEIYNWVKTHTGIFVPIDEPTQVVVAEILEAFPKLLDTRTNRSGADPWVIAVAQVKGCTVVTHESLTGRPQRPNIPDVCKARDIPWMGVLDVIKTEGWRI
jgi:hypothetical protein